VSLGCGILGVDLDEIIAIEIEGGRQQTVEELDSLQLVARAISAGGDTIPDAVIVWSLLDSDTDSTQVGFDLEAQTGLVIARAAPGSGRVMPAVGDVRPNEPITVLVLPAPDSVSPSGQQTVTMSAGEMLSPALETTVFDLTSNPDSVVPLAEKPVQFLVVQPPPGTADAAGFFLVGSAQDTVPPEDRHSLSTTTDASGRARAFVRRVSGSTLPDSAVINCTVFTATGANVAGSPVQLLVRFENN
jgi:hypothetical protein